MNRAALRLSSLARARHPYASVLKHSNGQTLSRTTCDGVASSSPAAFFFVRHFIKSLTLAFTWKRFRPGEVASIMLLLASCGSTTSEAPGPAAGASAGSLSSDRCSAGDTRHCVGPGACDGGQACGSDERWGACDCGASGGGGTAAVGGSSGGPSFGGASMSGTGGAAVGGESASETGAAGASTMNPGDEPCPTSPILLADCSGQCSAKGPTCDDVCPVSLSLTQLNDGQVIARLPSPPAAPCLCSVQGVQPAAYSALINVNVANPPRNSSFHLSVPPPWFVALDNGGRVHCARPEASCLAVSGAGLGVWTADPNAPAINLTVEAGPCP